jgi:hypothetical protein
MFRDELARRKNNYKKKIETRTLKVYEVPILTDKQLELAYAYSNNLQNAQNSFTKDDSDYLEMLRREKDVKRPARKAHYALYMTV